ncbi:hypothetical protein DFH11DRAFT_1595642 [Phellopilus nigrolimitatus]|nr:hypothetical protein DFH11DRAFT_1595642 [Phellopilus nigrolimitatus]
MEPKSYMWRELDAVHGLRTTRVAHAAFTVALVIHERQMEYATDSEKRTSSTESLGMVGAISQVSSSGSSSTHGGGGGRPCENSHNMPNNRTAHFCREISLGLDTGIEHSLASSSIRLVPKVNSKIDSKSLDDEATSGQTEGLCVTEDHEKLPPFQPQTHTDWTCISSSSAYLLYDVQQREHDHEAEQERSQYNSDEQSPTPTLMSSPRMTPSSSQLHVSSPSQSPSFPSSLLPSSHSLPLATSSASSDPRGSADGYAPVDILNRRNPLRTHSANEAAPAHPWLPERKRYSLIDTGPVENAPFVRRRPVSDVPRAGNLTPPLRRYPRARPSSLPSTRRGSRERPGWNTQAESSAWPRQGVPRYATFADMGFQSHGIGKNGKVKKLSHEKSRACVIM